MDNGNGQIRIGCTGDFRAVRALVRHLSGEEILAAMRGAMRRTCKTVQASVKEEARAVVPQHRAAPVRNGSTGMLRVYRPVWRDVRVAMRRPERGAEIAGEVALKTPKPRRPDSRAWLARILNSGTGPRWTKGKGRVQKKRAYRGAVQPGRNFFAPGVRRGLPRAEQQFVSETERAMRRVALRSK